MQKRVGLAVPGAIPKKLIKTIARCCKCSVSDLDIVYLGYNFTDGYEIALEGMREHCEFLVLAVNEKLLCEVFYGWNEIEYNVLAVPQWQWRKLCSKNNEEQDKTPDNQRGILGKVTMWFKNLLS